MSPPISERQIAAVRLEFFQPVALPVVAIGTTTDVEFLVAARQGDLTLVLGAAARGEQKVPGNSLLCRGGRRESGGEIATFRGKFAQRSNGDGVPQRHGEHL